MPRTTSKKEMLAFLKLDGPARFARFVEQVVDEERAWGLWGDGWALLEDDSGGSVFPLWPAREYAQLCAVDDWAELEPSEIPLANLLDGLLPKLEAEGVRPGIASTTDGNGVVVEPEELADALRLEMAKHE